MQSDSTCPRYFYMGFQSDGAYEGWPATPFCDPGYDPRFRPWYSSASSGPKKVVIVVDESGSMSGNREALARRATAAVLDTLTEKDKVVHLAPPWPHAPSKPLCRSGSLSFRL